MAYLWIQSLPLIGAIVCAVAAVFGKIYNRWKLKRLPAQLTKSTLRTYAARDKHIAEMEAELIHAGVFNEQCNCTEHIVTRMYNYEGSMARMPSYRFTNPNNPGDDSPVHSQIIGPGGTML